MISSQEGTDARLDRPPARETEQETQEPADDVPAAPSEVRKAAGGRSRRASVPSWDEIMFGNSRQPD